MSQNELDAAIMRYDVLEERPSARTWTSLAQFQFCRSSRTFGRNRLGCKRTATELVSVEQRFHPLVASDNSKALSRGSIQNGPTASFERSMS